MTNDGYNTLVFDGENRQLSATNGGSSGTNSYDGRGLGFVLANPKVKNGLRVEKVSASTTTVTIFSGGQDIAEYVNGAAPSSPSVEFIYAGSQLIADISGSTTYYFHQDQLSNRLLTDSSGNVATQRGNFPFGEEWYQTGVSTKWKFTNYARDTESGNDYALARSYVNRLARFSSLDPIGGDISDPQSLNAYAYVENDPVDLADPAGLTPKLYEPALTADAFNNWLFEMFLLGSDPNSDLDINPTTIDENGDPVETDNPGSIFGFDPFPPGVPGEAGAGALAAELRASAPPPPNPNGCDPMMIAAFQHIWNNTMRFSNMQREAYFTLDLGEQGFGFAYGVGPIVGPGVVPHAEVPIDSATIAIGHTHPGNGTPSAQDRLSPVPNYVVSQFSVIVTDPRKPTPAGDRQVRGANWNKPCP